MFEVAQDLAIDVPAVYANFGKLLGQTFAKGHLTFKVLKGALGALRESDKAGLVMCEVWNSKHSYASRYLYILKISPLKFPSELLSNIVIYCSQ